MSHLDDSYHRAQRSYDNMEPPEDVEVECPICDGHGTLYVSDCCETEVIDHHLCTKCHETCQYKPCDNCGGEGIIVMDKQEYKRMLRERKTE